MATDASPWYGALAGSIVFAVAKVAERWVAKQPPRKPKNYETEKERQALAHEWADLRAEMRQQLADCRADNIELQKEVDHLRAQVATLMDQVATLRVNIRELGGPEL